MSASRHLLTVVRGCRHGLRVIATSTPLRLGVFGLLALVATWNCLSAANAVNDFRDAHFHSHYESFAVASITRFHQAPLWDPYYCGGMYLLGGLQPRFVSPTLLLSIVFGERRGEAVTAFVMLIVGLEGTFRYARSRGGTSFAALLAAPVFGLLGMFALSNALGWVNFYAFELLPWAALGLRRAMRGQVSGIIVAASSLAWCVGFGGTYAAPMAALWCAFEVIDTVVIRLRNREGRRVGAAVRAAVVVGSLALGLSAFHLWPVMETIRETPRIIGGAPGTTARAMLRMLFVPVGGDHDEGAFFVGAFALPAVALGLWRLRSIAPVIGLATSIWLAAGYAVKPSLFAAMRALPVYETLRCPERFLILAALFASVLAARGITTMEALARLPQVRFRRPPSKSRPALAATLCAIGAIGLMIDVGPLVAQHLLQASARSMIAPPSEALSERSFHQARGNRWELLQYMPMNRGSLSCYEGYPVPQSTKLRGDLGAEEYLQDPGAGTVAETRWSPNEIDLEVALDRPTRLLVNQIFTRAGARAWGRSRATRGSWRWTCLPASTASS